MTRKMGSIVVAYGLLLGALSFVLQQISPAQTNTTFFTGFAGAGLSVLWGLLGLTGYKRRSWAVLTLIGVALVLLNRAVQAWSLVANQAQGSLQPAMLLSLLFLLTLGMLMYLLHGDRTPDFYQRTPVTASAPPVEGGKQHR